MVKKIKWEGSKDQAGTAKDISWHQRTFQEPRTDGQTKGPDLNTTGRIQGATQTADPNIFVFYLFLLSDVVFLSFL